MLVQHCVGYNSSCLSVFYTEMCFCCCCGGGGGGGGFILFLFAFSGENVL